MDNILEIVIVVFIGLVFGSFATALSYRLPRGISIVKKKRSSCPSCNENLKVIDLVPLFSWVFLKGKCRKCKSNIGLRYPLIELATLSLCMLFYFIYGLKTESFLIFLLAPLLVSIVDIDLNYKIIPDSVNFSILILGILFFFSHSLVYASPASFIVENIGYVVGGFLLYGLGSLVLRQIAMLIMKREPMGLGDIKFFAAIGVWLGFDAEILSSFMIVAGISGILLALIWKKLKDDKEFPFAPSLILAFIMILCLYPVSYG